MSNAKLDKSAVCTAFVCAVAAFACGFAFCLALLSSAGSCYLLVKDFLFTTRGYVWFQQLKTIVSPQGVEAFQLFVLLLVLFFAFVALVRIFFQKGHRLQLPCAENIAPMKQVSSKEHSSAIFADETEVASVLNVCRRHPGDDGWHRLNAQKPELLALCLKNEYPQVASVVLLRLDPRRSAEVLSLLPRNFAAETLSAMLNSHPVDAGLAGTIGRVVAENAENAKENDTEGHIGKILSCMSVDVREQIMSAMEKEDVLFFADFGKNKIVFEDFALLHPAELERVLEQVGEPKLVIAMRGASENLCNHIYAALSPRQAKVLRDTLARLGPIKLRDIEKAQSELVVVAEDMFADVLRSRKNG